MKIINLIIVLLIFCVFLNSCKDDFDNLEVKTQKLKIESTEIVSIEIARNYQKDIYNLKFSILDSIKIRNISHTVLTNLNLVVKFYSKSVFSDENLLLSYQLLANNNNKIELKANEEKVFFLDDNARIIMDNALVETFVIGTGSNFDFKGSGMYNSYYNYYKYDTINKSKEKYDTTFFEKGTATGIVDFKGNLFIKSYSSSIFNLVTGNIDFNKHFLGKIKNNSDTIGNMEARPIFFPVSLNDSTINIFSLDKKTANDNSLYEFQFIFFKN
jgi:hypothetical protein